MGYTTDFVGNLTFEKPLSEPLREYLKNFFAIRHYCRDVELIKQQLEKKNISLAEVTPPCGIHKNDLGENGCFFAPTELMEMDFDKKISQYGITHPTYCKDYNMTPADCPSLWCDWRYDDDTNSLYLLCGKTYAYVEWLEWLMRNIFSYEPNDLNGCITWQGEDMDDKGQIIVQHNKIISKTTINNIPEKVYIVSETEAINCSEYDRTTKAFTEEQKAKEYFEKLKEEVKNNKTFFDDNQILLENCKELTDEHTYEIIEGNTYDNSISIKITEYEIEQ